MSELTKAEMLSVICELQSTVSQMYSAYANDVSQGRAEAMHILREHGTKIAQGCIDRFPLPTIERAISRHPQPNIDDKVGAARGSSQ